MRVTPALIRKVDQLAALNAEIAKLDDKAKAIKADLIRSKADVIESDRFRAVIIRNKVTQLNSEAVRRILTAAQLSDCSLVCKSTAVWVTPRTAS
jgi:septal ring factor EnvC (AmiA/AmiB activator)